MDIVNLCLTSATLVLLVVSCIVNAIWIPDLQRRISELEAVQDQRDEWDEGEEWKRR